MSGINLCNTVNSFNSLITSGDMEKITVTK
jgi:hypothetical protein